jgi:uncharacterized phosphosugar-binding protein
VRKDHLDLADVVVDTCAPLEDASVVLKNHQDKIGPVSTMAFITCVWMTVTTVAEILADKGVKLIFIRRIMFRATALPGSGSMRLLQNTSAELQGSENLENQYH